MQRLVQPAETYGIMSCLYLKASVLQMSSWFDGRYYFQVIHCQNTSVHTLWP